MTEHEIRAAKPEDRQNILRCVNVAYAVYVGIVGRRPAPMLANYDELIEQGAVHVIDGARGIDGVLVTRPHDDHLLVENVAVRPSRQKQGLGRKLIALAEDQAMERGLPEVRLMTHVKMEGNFTVYPRWGYEETERRSDDGYERAYFSKQLQPLAD